MAMKKRDKKLKLFLGIIFILFIAFLFLRLLKMNAFVYAETDTYQNSYWLCPDGTKGEHNECQKYSDLLSEAETFCQNHCTNISLNIKQCNAEFHRGTLCASESDIPSPNEKSNSSGTTTCYDTDENLEINQQVRTKGKCTDSLGENSDVSMSERVISEYSCQIGGTNQNEKYCFGDLFDCNSINLVAGSDGTCVESNTKTTDTTPYNDKNESPTEDTAPPTVLNAPETHQVESGPPNYLLWIIIILIIILAIIILYFYLRRKKKKSK